MFQVVVSYPGTQNKALGEPQASLDDAYNVWHQVSEDWAEWIGEGCPPLPPSSCVPFYGEIDYTVVGDDGRRYILDEYNDSVPEWLAIH